MLRLDHRAYLLGLIFECPLGCEGESCPLGKVRQLPLAERVEFANSLDDQEVSNIVYYHESCFRQRLRANGWHREVAVPSQTRVG